MNSSTNFQERKSCPEAARDLQLVVQLVSWTGRPRDQPEQVEGSTDHHINLWIKASIMKRDLSLEQRRRPKGETKWQTPNKWILFVFISGAAAQIAAKKRRQEEAAAAESGAGAGLTDDQLIGQIRLRYGNFTENQKMELCSIIRPWRTFRAIYKYFYTDYVKNVKDANSFSSKNPSSDISCQYIQT